GRSCVCPPLPATCAAPAVDAPAFTTDGALLRQLMALLSCAETSVHAALYETLWACLPDAILARLAAAPGLTVQLVYDDETCPRVAGTLMCPLARLDGNPRVSLLPDGRAALMHHKYFVVDGARVWVGSANSSENSYCRDANDAVVIEEPAIVATFEAEFQRMFRDHSFGPIAAATPATGGRYAAYFSPRSPTSTAARWFTDMVDAVAASRTSVDFVISAWTRTELSDAMIAARARGVTVRGIVSREYLNDAPAVALLAAGVPVRSGDVHSKLLVIDGQTVITGSANWSAAAWANNENSLWIRDAAAATAYTGYFTAQYATATVPAGM
ncbi:MAG: putative Phospholipase, partial [Myxococcaceae bacterium]|nr:putative Phospholipase [Myxococcaceae bacterium]